MKTYIKLKVNYKVSPYFLHYISIWSINFQFCPLPFHCYVDLISAVISWMKKVDMSNRTIKNCFSCHIICQLILLKRKTKLKYARLIRVPKAKTKNSKYMKKIHNFRTYSLLKSAKFSNIWNPKKKKKDFGKNNKILMVVANLLVFSIDLMWLRWR